MSDEINRYRAVLQAVNDDPMACHSIAVWELIKSTLGLQPGAAPVWEGEMPPLPPPDGTKPVVGTSDE